MLQTISSHTSHSLLQRHNASPNSVSPALLKVRAPVLRSHIPTIVTIPHDVHNRDERVAQYGYAESSAAEVEGTAIVWHPSFVVRTYVRGTDTLFSVS